jgi:hypothetical protein
MIRIKKFVQILLFNSCYNKYSNFAFSVIILMINSEDCNIKNHTTFSEDQLSADDQSHLVSVGAILKTSQSEEINQQIDTNGYYKVARELYFLICDSCLWCASYFGNEMTNIKCPLCHKGKIDCMPIGDDEMYSFNHNTSRAVELMFSNNFRS